MILRFCSLIFLFFIANFCEANMGSPVYQRTSTSSAITSKDINISSERIYIKIDNEFRTAKFIVEYIIQSDVNGVQIPLLFFAKDYKDNFLVWVDGREVTTQNIPIEYTKIDDSPFDNFSDIFDKENTYDSIDRIVISWDKNENHLYKMKDLKYFETDISKGTHKIRVEYNAEPWEDFHNWVTEYSFHYSLTPAKYWKSFGTLEVILEQEEEMKQIRANIGKPNEQKIQAKNTWSFDKLPAEYLIFSYVPKVNFLANILIFIQPLGLTIILALFIFSFHILLIKVYRKKKPSKKYSITLILTSIIVPFLLLLFYLNSFDLIDAVIGKHAGSYHGYTFLAILTYPILLIIYGLFVWFADSIIKEKLLEDK